MADVPTLQPELSRSVSALARTLVAAAGRLRLHPPDHLDARGSLDRRRHAIAEAASARNLGSATGAAGGLHDRDILQITFADPVENPHLADARKAGDRGGYPWAVVEAVDPDVAGIDALAFM